MSATHLADPMLHHDAPGPGAQDGPVIVASPFPLPRAGEVLTAEALNFVCELHHGARTEAGVRENIRVGVQYLAPWLGGRGAVPLYNLMEDAATAEICRTQLWQWLRFEAELDDGRRLTRPLFDRLFAEELAALPHQPHLDVAARLFAELVTLDELAEFLSLVAYERL